MPGCPETHASGAAAAYGESAEDTLVDKLRRAEVRLDVGAGDTSGALQLVGVAHQPVQCGVELVGVLHAETSADGDQVVRLAEFAVVRPDNHGNAVDGGFVE